MTLEAKEEAKLVKWCKEMKLDCLKLQLLNERGFPDRTILTPDGRHMFIEMKKPGGNLSIHQQRWITTLRKRHHEVRVCYSGEEAIEEVKLWLARA